MEKHSSREPGEIMMFRLKPLKSSTVPLQWMMLHFDGLVTTGHYCRYKAGEWTKVKEFDSVAVTLKTLADMIRSKEICWLVMNGMYPWLCWQGMFKQLEDGAVSLPLGSGNSNAGKLTGQFSCGDPCIIDVTVGEKRFHCCDLANFGIDETTTCCEAVQLTQEYVRMILEKDMGTIKSTAAAQGMARFRTHDLGDKRIYPHQMPVVRQMERDAFYGGRTECYSIKRIQEPVWNYDYRSLHPTLGLTQTFPTKLIDFGSRPSLEKITRRLSSSRHVIAKVRIITDEPDYPVRHDFSGLMTDWRTIYPVGEFVTTLCNPEIRHAWLRGRIKEVFSFAAYESEAIFADNSAWYFRTKQSLAGQNLSHMAGSLKLAQNSTYGGIGRRGKRWIDMACWHDADWGMWWMRHPEVGNIVQGRAIYGQHQYLDSGGEPETSCPAIAGTMFSYSRLALLNLIQAAGRENVHLVDTDGGLITAWSGDTGLLSSGLVVSKWESSDVDIRGIKYYRHDSTWLHAGVPAWAERHLDGSASFEKHEPFNYGLWHGTPFAHKYLIARNNPYPPYKHGVVDRAGRTWPFEMRFDACRGKNVVV